MKQHLAHSPPRASLPQSHATREMGSPYRLRLDDTPAPPRDQRPCRLAMLANAQRSTRFVLAHESRIADNVDSHNRCEAASFGHCTPKILETLAQVRYA